MLLSPFFAKNVDSTAASIFVVILTELTNTDSIRQFNNSNIVTAVLFTKILQFMRFFRVKLKISRILPA